MPQTNSKPARPRRWMITEVPPLPEAPADPFEALKVRAAAGDPFAALIVDGERLRLEVQRDMRALIRPYLAQKAKEARHSRKRAILTCLRQTRQPAQEPPRV